MSRKRVAIDNVNPDALREILIRVAGSPNGATYLARAFAVCKAFQKFSEDGDVLRAVVFDNLPVSRRAIPFSTPELEERNSQEYNYQVVYSQYEPFQHVGGLINRSALAGHPDAQFILAKIVMVSASELYRANSEAFLGDDNLKRRHAKVSSFIADFSTKTAVSERASSPVGNLSCSNLVRMFLTQASSIEVITMKPFLKDFVRYFLDPRTEARYQRLLSLFEEFSKDIILLLQKSESLYNAFDSNLCTQSRKALLASGADLQQLLDLARFAVQKNDYIHEVVGAENFNQKMEILDSALHNGGIQGDNNEEEPLNGALGKVIFMNQAFKLSLLPLKMVGSCIKNQRVEVISEFDALFSV